MAGRQCQLCMAAMADRSNLGNPDVAATFTLDIRPLASSFTRSTTRPCSLRRIDAGG